MSGKFALIIGNTEYTDPGLAQLTAPGKDAEDFARVLKDKEIGAFDDVAILLNQPEYVVREAIDDFFNLKMPDDLLVLYFSGHGVRDELGALYLAVKNTVRSKLRATGIKSDYIREAMDQSRSRRQVLILDCCNSGAFAQGTKAATGVSIGTASAFEGGYGRVVLTASDSTQFAWEGDKVIGETDNSLFTHYLVEGLEGEADLDGDGRITVDELYDYAYVKVKFATPKQTPSKFSTKQQGEIVLRQSIRVENIKPVALPDDLLDEIEDTRPYVREAAVQKLEKIINGRNIGLARSAREALGKIATDDDSRRVSIAATHILDSFRSIELLDKEKPSIAFLAKRNNELMLEEQKDTERLISTEQDIKKLDRLAPQREAGNKFNYPRWVLVFWISLSWASGWAILLPIIRLRSSGWSISLEIIWACCGAVAGLVSAIGLKTSRIFSSANSIFWFTLIWAIAAAIGQAIYDAIGSIVLMVRGGPITPDWWWECGRAIGWGIGGYASAIILRTEHLLFNWRRIIVIAMAWATGSFISSSIVDEIFTRSIAIGDYFTSTEAFFIYSMGGSIFGLIGGFVLIWQIRHETERH